MGTGLVGAPACGDVMKLQIMVDPETGKIMDVAFKTFGCGSAIASSSLATEKIKGLTIWEASKIKNTEIAKELALPPVKLHCSSEFTSASFLHLSKCQKRNSFTLVSSACGGCHQISSKGLGSEEEECGGCSFERNYSRFSAFCASGDGVNTPARHFTSNSIITHRLS